MSRHSFRIAAAAVILAGLGLLIALGPIKSSLDSQATRSAPPGPTAVAEPLPTMVKTAPGAESGDTTPDVIPTPTPMPLPTKPNAEEGAWKLTFSDEFRASALDTSKWNTQWWWGRSRADEVGYYTDDAVEVVDGVLRLRADKRKQGGYDYTTGVVTTLGKFSQRYGFFEARVKVPAGQGFHAGIWLLPDAGNHRSIWPPEIDIAEFRGDQPHGVLLNYHYATADSPNEQDGSWFEGPDFTAGFHVFGLEWRPDALIWYVDGVERHRVQENLPTQKMYLIANLALGGGVGKPTRSTPFPSWFDVSYIRVWQADAPGDNQPG